MAAPFPAAGGEKKEEKTGGARAREPRTRRGAWRRRSWAGPGPGRPAPIMAFAEARRNMRCLPRPSDLSAAMAPRRAAADRSIGAVGCSVDAGGGRSTSWERHPQRPTGVTARGQEAQSASPPGLGDSVPLFGEGFHQKHRCGIASTTTQDYWTAKRSSNSRPCSSQTAR